MFATSPLWLPGRIAIKGNDSFTKLLLHFDVAGPGAPRDYSANPSAITAGGAIGAGRANMPSKRFRGAGIFDGSTSYIGTPADAKPAAAAGDFTLDFWVYTNNTSDAFLLSIGR